MALLPLAGWILASVLTRATASNMRIDFARLISDLMGMHSTVVSRADLLHLRGLASGLRCSPKRKISAKSCHLLSHGFTWHHGTRENTMLLNYIICCATTNVHRLPTVSFFNFGRKRVDVLWPPVAVMRSSCLRSLRSARGAHHRHCGGTLPQLLP